MLLNTKKKVKNITSYLLHNSSVVESLFWFSYDEITQIFMFWLNLYKIFH